MNGFTNKTGLTSEGQQNGSFPSHNVSSSSAQWTSFSKPKCQQVSADIRSVDRFSPSPTASHPFHESSEKDPHEALEHSNSASSLASPPPSPTPKYPSERGDTSWCMDQVRSTGTLRRQAQKIAISSLPLPRPIHSASSVVKPEPIRPLEQQPSKIDSPIRLAPSMLRDIEGASSLFTVKDFVPINYKSNGETNDRALKQEKVKGPLQRTVPLSLYTNCTKNVVEKKTTNRESTVDNQIIDMMGTMVGTSDDLDECPIDFNEIIGDIIGDKICNSYCPEPRESLTIEVEVTIHIKSRKRKRR